MVLVITVYFLVIRMSIEGYIYENMATHMNTINYTTNYLYTFANTTVSWVSRI